MILIYLFLVCVQAQELLVKDGDIIFQRSRSQQSKAIQKGTQSPYSHVGIIYIEKGLPMVLEASSVVSSRPLTEWIASGEGQDYRIMRSKKELTTEQLETMKSLATSYLGIRYDPQFQWSDQKMYCSELVWKLYKHGAGITLSRPQKMKDYDFSHPALVQEMQRRWKGTVNWNEKVVAPSDLAQSSKLKIIENTF